MMKKEQLIILAVVAVVGVAVMLYLKNKNKI